MSKYLLENSVVDGYLLESGLGSYLLEADDIAVINEEEQPRSMGVILV